MKKLNVEHFLQVIEEDDYLKSSFLKENFTLERLNSSICGITCLQMCINYFNNIKIKLSELVEKSIKFGVLDINIGCKHYKLIEFARQYNLEGCLIKEERLDRLKTLINFMIGNNILVIASVSPGIIQKNEIIKKNGHLVLITGIDEDNLFINDPENFENYSAINKIVGFDRFFDNFSGNLICLSKNNFS